MSCLDDKRYGLHKEIYTLTYFHKDIVTSCKEIKKDCNKKEIEKDCEEIEKDKKRL